MDNKLYVGNLPYRATEEELRTLFAQAGTVNSVSIISDRETGRSRGFAFVEMADGNDAQKAIRQFNGYRMENRELVVNVARPKDERGGGGGGGSFGGGGGGSRGGFGGGGRGGFGGDRGDRGDRGDSRRGGFRR